MRRTLVSASIMAVIGVVCPLSAPASPLQGGPADGENPLHQGAGPLALRSGSAGQIDALNTRIAVLEAQLKIAKLKASIKKANEDQSLQGATPAAMGPAMPFQGVPSYPAPMMSSGQVGALQGVRAPALPRIESISGSGTHLGAMVSLPDGGQRIVTPGSGLPGGLVVRSITPNGVEVSGKNGFEWLSFMNGRSSRSTNASQGGPADGENPLQGTGSVGAMSPMPAPMFAPPGANPMPGAAPGGE